MRIGIFSESYEPIINGVSVCVATLRDELSERGHEVHIFAPAYKGHCDAHGYVYRFPAIHTFLARDYPFPIPYSPRMRQEFESLELDVVHTQTPFLLGMLGARWVKAAGIPLVSTNHTLYTEYLHYASLFPKTFSRSVLVRHMKKYYSGCDAVVVPSGPVQGILREYGVESNMTVIKTGVVKVNPISEREREDVRRGYGIGPDDSMVLYVGRIAREKNLTMLLDAFCRVRDTGVKARLLLVGGGPAMNETMRYAESLGLGETAKFVGMLPRQDIHPIYASADIFVFPSTTETQGIAICEALSAGLPVVAVNAGGIPENINPEQDGFLTKNDPEEFAFRIMELINNPGLRSAMGNAACINSSCFSIDRMTDDFERLYESVAKR